MTTNLADIPRAARRLERVEHQVDVAVTPDAVFRILADVTLWPVILPPTVHAEQLSLDGNREHIRIVAAAGDTARSWESLRTIDAEARSIAFRQIRFQDPIGHMEGRWQVRDNGIGGSTVVLEHGFAASEPERQGWLAEVVDRNSRTELDALRAALEGAPASDDPRLIEFADSIVVDGPREAVRAFIDEADRWSQRLPHVATVAFTRLPDGVQDLAMTTRSPDGSEHDTRSFRVALEDGSIVYKQFTLPALMASHLGRWTFRADGVQTVATSAHTVLIATEHLAVLGPDTDLAAARRTVQAALSANSRATLALAKQHVESGAP